VLSFFNWMKREIYLTTHCFSRCAFEINYVLIMTEAKPNKQSHNNINKYDEVKKIYMHPVRYCMW